MKLDKWQKEVLETKGDICLRSGRQVGKSTVISLKAAEYAIENRNKTVLVIASVERQSYLLFEKILAYLLENYKGHIKSGKDKPTKHRIMLRNGSVIHSLPTGMSGYGIRGYTIDLLIADEAAFIPEDVWTAVTPMIAVTHGNIILLSTPHGKEGFYFDCFQDKKFTSFHVSSEECPRMDLNWLKREKERMTKVQYAQEYLGEFIDELRQFFPTELIKKCLTLKREENLQERPVNPSNSRFMGVDVGGLGEDDSVLFSVKKTNDNLIQVDMEITNGTLTTETSLRIISSDKRKSNKKIYVDDGGIGFGVFSELLDNEQTRRKVVAINNARRKIEHGDEAREKGILKEDLYNNLKNLMEKGKMLFFNEPEIRLSLKSIQYEIDPETKKIKIFGKYSHIAEAAIRAAWCTKDKSLNILAFC